MSAQKSSVAVRTAIVSAVNVAVMIAVIFILRDMIISSSDPDNMRLVSIAVLVAVAAGLGFGSLKLVPWIKQIPAPVTRRKR